MTGKSVVKKLLPNPDELRKYRQWQRGVFFSKADLIQSQKSKIKSQNYSLKVKSLQKVVKYHLNSEITHLEKLPRATLHDVFRVKTPGGNYIVRTRAEEIRAFEFYLDELAFKEMAKLGVRSCGVAAVDVSRTLVPFDYEILTEAAGSLIHDRVRIGRIRPEVFRGFGRVVAVIHNVKTRKYGPFDMEKLISGGIAEGIWLTWTDYLLVNLDEHVQTCLEAGILTDADAMTVREILPRILFSLPPVPPTLLHGDLANHNAFTDGKSITALVDWEDAVSGDPVYDIAYYGTGCFGHDDWLKEFIEGYVENAALPADFERRYAGYYIRIALAKAVGRLKHGKKGRGLPDSAKRIQEGVRALKSV
ncbi:hypothetical protein A2Z33_03910 [Candidatus Gottesmanbacteria bacterium RBG_16_52_11]|uniref:Aminoglycoside phosphotransferase domain-containing protein n=1 Tax=Candidatus Gottesmanbacteria bacterium RBG_16_52_11 TaxID=1798374 RepID=A0A1F5YWC0_9BACT|nr:MAG: hypothetical protein A2Z33_03910 [Candidatus Gottesmanbacteria bacterium RBG_16_52_11]